MSPEPVDIQVCSECREPWESHVSAAISRSTREWYENHGDDEPAPFRLIRTETEVTFQDCVYLLKTKNMGPAGPVGPMGLPGRDGRDADRPHSGPIEVPKYPPFTPYS